MRCLCALFAALLLMNSPALSQSQRGQGSRNFMTFLATFKAAVQSGDKEAVASMTSLPFMFEGEELDKSAFIAHFGSLFDRPIKTCLLRAKPIKDGAYFEVSCTETSLLFRKIGGTYKFVEIGIND